jgi:hypothetical protein
LKEGKYLYRNCLELLPVLRYSGLPVIVITPTLFPYFKILKVEISHISYQKIKWSVSIRKTSRWILQRDTIYVRFNNHEVDPNAICGQHTEFCVLNQEVQEAGNETELLSREEVQKLLFRVYGL